MNKREAADITKVEKKGEVYLVRGTAQGRKASFFTDARSLDSMSPKEAESFLRRSVRNTADRNKEDD